ncbi:hypothetical protein M413DRAFT_192714 [Hebeloma cylindrosporum]|uniref:Uncharacterized protein n=1 Tax=Hebeloma cylindrosporum TaxID=76867 RepID=A0A0C2XPH7_HEBCY|nr:hypothetical protein M413DRAFT_192714 [Hebeloma cylindrosporum h7]
MSFAYSGTLAAPRTYDEISNAVKNFKTTQEWFDFYLAEARRLKEDEIMPQRKSRLEYLTNFASQAVAARTYHLANGPTRYAVCSATAKAGAIPGGKVIMKPIALSYFCAEAIKCYGMGDREDVNRFYREALSKAGLATNLSECLQQLDDSLKSESRTEYIKEIWKDDDLQARLMEEMNKELGAEMAANVAEEAVHIASFIGHAISAFRGWHSSGKAIDKALGYLSNATFEFHKKAFIPVVIARTFPPPVRQAAVVPKQQTWSNWFSQAAASVLEALPERTLSVTAGVVATGLAGGSINSKGFEILDKKCYRCNKSRAVCYLKGDCGPR